jgi:hypothetical protein
MRLRNFTNKKLSLFSLTSLLLVGFCLLPCGGSAAMAAKADHVQNKSHKEMGSMDHAAVGGMEAHNCHGGNEGTLQITDDAKTASCLYCNISSPSAFQEARSFSFIAFDLSRDAGFDYSQSYSIVGGLLNLDLPPPGYNQPIYILNSTYII